jgi:alpha/beta superfamily hydrolase
VKGIVALGVPMQALGRNYAYRFLPGCPQPKLFISGTQDEFATVPDVEELTASTTHAKLIWVAEADHFFAGKLDQVRDGIQVWMRENFLPSGQLATEDGTLVR